MSDSEAQSTYAFGPYRLVPARRQLLGPDGEPIVLRGKAYDLLWYLLQHRGRPVAKSELLDAIWPNMVVEENNLNQAVSALRQALDDDAKTPAYIATLKGRGYQFVGEVTDEKLTGSANQAAPRRASRAIPVIAVLATLGIALYFAVERTPAPVAVADGVPVVERFGDATRKLITDGKGTHTSPTLSPDGNMIAYVSDADGLPQIWIKNLQRGDPIRITDGPYAARSPSWSPDNEQIIFTRAGPNGAGIFSVGTLGKPGPRHIVDFGAQSRFSLQADAFVYARGSQVWLAENDGRDRRQIQGLPRSQGFAKRQPALSPDGKLLAFIHAEEGPLGNLWIIPTDGGDARQLTTPESGGGYASAPAWSHNGRYIVYSVNAESGDEHLWRVDVNSGEAAALTTGPGGASNPALSRDGRRLAYTATRTIWRLTRIDTTTGQRTSILDSRSPIVLSELSRDGEAVTYFSVLPSGMQVFAVDVDGSNLQQLTFDEPGENSLPTWSGDGQAILYYRGRSLHLLDPSTGSDTQVFSDFHWSTRNWLNASANRITFHNVDRPNRQQKTFVRELGESDAIELPVPIEAAKLSADATEIVGFYRATSEIYICNIDASRCQSIDDDGEPVTGFNPTWSNDEQQVYFLQYAEPGRCCSLWRIDRNGGRKQEVAVLADFDRANSFYGIAPNGDIIYNHVDRSTEEIWLAVIED